MSKLIVFLWLQGYSYSEGSATGSLIAASVIAADGIQPATRMRQVVRCFLFTLRAGRKIAEIAIAKLPKMYSIFQPTQTDATADAGQVDAGVTGCIPGMKTWTHWLLAP